MNVTEKYGFRKPEEQDYVSIDDLNFNTDRAEEVMGKMEDALERQHKKRQILLSASGWSDSYPYTQTVEVDGVKAEDDIKIIGAVHPAGGSEAQDKAIDKAAGFLMTNDSGVENGKLIFKAKKKPEINITVITEGG